MNHLLDGETSLVVGPIHNETIRNDLLEFASKSLLNLGYKEEALMLHNLAKYGKVDPDFEDLNPNYKDMNGVNISGPHPDKFASEKIIPLDEEGIMEFFLKGLKTQ